MCLYVFPESAVFVSGSAWWSITGLAGVECIFFTGGIWRARVPVAGECAPGYAKPHVVDCVFFLTCTNFSSNEKEKASTFPVSTPN